MRHERGEEHPRPVEVQRIERAGEEIVELHVQHPRDELEEPAADQQQQRDTLERVRQRTGRWQREQLRHHRPQLRQQYGDQRDAERDMHALREPVQPVRVRRPGEEVEAEDPLVRGLVVDRGQARVVRRVRDESRHEEHGDADEQYEAQYGGEPGAAQRAAPEGGRGGGVAHDSTVGRECPPSGCATHDETLTSGPVGAVRDASRPSVPV